MKIISKHRDYYDSALAFGHDSSVIYHRNHELLISAHLSELKDLSVFASKGSSYKYGWRSNDLGVTSLNVLFCGKFYHGATIRWRSCGASSYSEATVYSLDELNKVSTEFKLDIKQIMSERRYQELEAHLSEQGTPAIDLAVKLKSPAVVGITDGEHVKHVSVYKNVFLKDFHFYKVVDSYTAFQEIDMFLSGILAPENKPMVQIDDKYKIQEHGFDRFSFRKSPTKVR